MLINYLKIFYFDNKYRILICIYNNFYTIFYMKNYDSTNKKSIKKKVIFLFDAFF